MNKVCVLIHGYLTDYKDFKSLPYELIKKYDQVILLCLPGHNHKDSLDEFTKDNVFKYIHKQMDEIIKNDIVDVIGYSLGGALSWYIALNYNINKLILLAPANNYINFFLYNAQYNYLKSLNKLEETTKEELKKEYKLRQKEAFEFAKKTIFQKFTIKNGFNFVKIIYEINKNNSNINNPLLVIRGDLDELSPRKSVDLVFNRCENNNKEMYNIPDIGHMMLRTNKEMEIINKIITFLNED